MLSAITPVVAVVTLAACTTSDPRDAEASAVLDHAIPQDGPGCSGAVAQEGDVIWTYARGMADVERAIPIDTATRFNIGSVSKQFTATAALMLAERGELALDDPVSAHLGGLPPWSDEVTVQDLMHHTSGIIDQLLPSGADVVIDRDALLRNLESRPALRKDRSSFHYANDNFLLLGLIVEDVAGTSLAEWMDDQVFSPYELDMAVDPGAIGEDIAVGYREAHEPFTVAPNNIFVAGPTGVIATPSELARWGDHYRSPQVLSADALEEALDRAASTDDDELGVYSAGVFESPDGTLWHDGSISGIHTFFAVSADRNMTFAISCNRWIVDAGEIVEDLGEIWFPENADVGG